MSDATSVTIVHLSDLHFGARHRHGRDGLASLADSLLTDLAFLAKHYGVYPNLLAVSGDLSEAARPGEFADAVSCLHKLREALDLSRSEVAMVPGNHDISWLKCQAYLLNCEADQVEPVPPLWPKYELYAEMFAAFYGIADDAPRFPKDLPWTLFEIPRLKTVVAGLNSTINESHRAEDHYGHCGRDQYEWFAEELAQYESAGWLRIGMLHHNPRIADQRDGKALRDVRDFERLLLPKLNVVLHGHRHERRLDSMGPHGVPVLGVGSAGVAVDKRAPEVPNQYQVLEIRRDGIRVFARRFDPGTGWVGDTAVGGDTPDSSTLSMNGSPARIEAAFPPKEETDRLQSPVGAERAYDLLDRVEEVIRVRNPEARVQRHDAGPGRPQAYLLVTAGAAKQVQQYPVGVVDGPATREAITAFVDQVDLKYRTVDRTLRSVLVHMGPAAPEDLRLWAGGLGVAVEEFVKFQGMYNLEPYAERQAARLEATAQIYPSGMFVPQRFSIARPRGGTSSEVQTDLLAKLQEWAGDTDGRFVVVLGDFGHGKTFLLRELTKLVHETKTPPVIPILIQLRDLEKAQKLDQLLAAQLAQGEERRIDLEHVRFLIREGRVLLLFDGFDELVLRVTYKEAAEHLAELVEAGEGRAKVVITSRTQHFLSDEDVETALLRLTDIPSRELVKLHDFDDPQILEFLTRLLEGRVEDAEQMMELLREVRDLIGLSRNPRMLSFIVQLDRERLERIRDQEGEISASRLYEELLNQWLTFEHERARPKGASPTLAVDERWKAITELALRLWNSETETLWLAEVSDVAGTLATLAELKLTTDQATHMLGSGTLLIRTDDGRFKFVHRSVMEWLVTRHIAEELRHGHETPAQLVARPISDLMAEFLTGQVPADRLVGWAGSVLTRSTPVDAAAWNALLILRTLGVSATSAAGGDQIELSHLELNGINLTGMDLSGANLRSTDLGKATLKRADLAGADLTGANLAGADLTGANLTAAKLENASLVAALGLGARLPRSILVGVDLSKAHFPRADLTSANLSRVRLHRTNLLQASLDPDALAWAAGTGSALTAGLPPKLNIASARYSPISLLAWNRDSGVLAIGDVDGTIRLWDPANRTVLRTLDGHPGGVSAAAWSPDGHTLATTSDTSGIIHLWDTRDGSALTTVQAHPGTVSAVAWSPDGRTLALGDDTPEVHLWDMQSRSILRILGDQPGEVTTMAWSPDGRTLAIAAISGEGNRLESSVLFWDVRDGSLLHPYQRVSGRASVLAWSPDGRSLTVSSDLMAFLWNTQDGSFRRLPGIVSSPVSAMAWGPDGHTLAIGGNNDEVLLRDARDESDLGTIEGRLLVGFTVSWHSDGRTLAIGTDGGAVQLWDARNGSLQGTIEAPAGGISCVAWSPNGHTLAVGSVGSRRVELWYGQEDSSLLGTLTHGVEALAWSPDGGFLAAADRSSEIKLYNALDGSVRDVLEVHDASTPMAWGPDDHTLAIGSSTGPIRLLDTRDGSATPILHDHVGAHSMAWSVNGDLAVIGMSFDLLVWNAQDATVRYTLEDQADGFSRVAWSPDGSILAVVRGDGDIQFLDAQEGSVLQTLGGHTGAITSMAWSPDGSTLATSSFDRTVRLWTSEGRPVATMVGLTEGSVAFGPEGLAYRVDGTYSGEFWWTVGLVRFEPGQLEDVPGVVEVPPGVPLREFAALEQAADAG